METVISILSGSATLGSLALTAYLVVKSLELSSQLNDARQAQYTVTEQVTETNYKLQQTQLALATALKLNDAQAKELADAIGTQPNTDLPKDDVHDRVARILSQFTTASTDTTATHPAGAAVPADATATKA